MRHGPRPHAAPGSRPGPPRPLWLLWLVAAAAALPGAVAAQDDPRTRPAAPPIRGTVVDAESGEPLVGAVIHLGEGRRALTGGDGTFEIRADGDGPWPLVVEQLGYRTAVETVAASALAGPLRLSLRADPILLEGLAVTVDRFERRRNAFAGSVRTLHSGDLAALAVPDGLAVLGRLILGFRECWPLGGVPGVCFRRRGETVAAKVCIDDRRAMDVRGELRSYGPGELYLVEVYDGGEVVLVYTRWYMEERTRGARVSALSPSLVC